MKKSLTLTKEDFDNLLGWLSADREEAGKKYEEIRNGLVRFFRMRDCADPLALTDDTLNRVADKIPKEKTDREKIPFKYIYGFAVNVYHEYCRLTVKKEIQLDLNLPFIKSALQDSPDTERNDLSCLEKCLAEMLPDDSAMMLKYYSEGSSARFDLRKQMAEGMNIKTTTLHTKVHRIKKSLRKCIDNCMNEKNL